MVILRHRLPGGWLRAIKDRFEGPQIPVAHDLSERLLVLQSNGKQYALVLLMRGPDHVP